MVKEHPRATLLIFTLGAAAEGQRRRLLPGSHEPCSAELLETCFAQALRAGESAGCRLVVSSPEAAPLPPGVFRLGQEGRSFGDRLATAYAHAYRRFAGPLVVLGSDVPDVRDHHVTDALSHLEADRNAVVIGPSPDGGLYLFASYHPLEEVLRDVAWGRSDSRRRLVRRLRTAGLRIFFLQPLRDLDTRADLELWLSAARRSLGGAWRRLARRMIAVLHELRRPVVSSIPTRSRFVLFEAPGRAPPATS